MKVIRFLPVLVCAVFIASCIPFSFFLENESETEELGFITEGPIETEILPVASEPSALVAETISQPEFGTSARTYLEVLAGDIGDRLSGSGNETSAADYIKGKFEEFGYTTQSQWFTAYDDYEGTSFGSSNIIAIKKGLSDQQIIIGAHYDSVDDDGSQGADDNASGVAVLLEVAQWAVAVQTPYTIVFAAFGAEEQGLWGSANYVDELSRGELKNIIGMVNLDSLIAGDKTYVYGNEGPGSMRDWLLEDAQKKGFIVEGKTDEDMYNEDGTPCECSDYDAFEKSNIPFAYFEATNWDLSSDGMVQVDPKYGVDGEIRHTEYDTVEYIDETFPGRIDAHLNTFVTLLYDLITQY